MILYDVSNAIKQNVLSAPLNKTFPSFLLGLPHPWTISAYTLFHETNLTFFPNIISLPERRNKWKSVLEINIEDFPDWQR